MQKFKEDDPFFSKEFMDKNKIVKIFLDQFAISKMKVEYFFMDFRGLIMQNKI